MQVKREKTYNNFMTQKEKEFVCFLLGKLVRKKEHTTPDFYSESGICAPSVLQKRENTSSALQKQEEALTTDPNQDEKKTAPVQESTQCIDPTNIVKKKITSRSVIENVYDILYANSLLQTGPSPPTPREDAEKIAELLKVVGEELFSREKGAKLVKLLLSGVEYQEEESVSQIQNTLLCVLLHRIKYIPYNSSLASLLADMLPVFTRKTEVLVEKNNVKIISGAATYSTAGVVIAHIVLVVLQHKKKKQHPEMCRSIFQTLDAPTVKRAFDKVAPQHLWKLFSALIRGLCVDEAEVLRRILAEEAKKGLASRSACVVDSIHEFSNSKPAFGNKRA